MVQYFMDEEVLSQITARLIACDNNYYDCPSEVILTKNFLYVQEDNYDGTYNCHYKLPITKIISIQKYVSEDSSEMKEKNAYTPGILASAALALAGIVFIPSKQQEEKGGAFLKINFQNENNKTSSIFFKDCSSGCIRKMVRAFDKCKLYYG